jgi:uracil-DNA glycosylase family 4
MNEISKQLIDDIQKCQLCKTIIGHKKFPVTSHGQLNGKYLLVSEAPGKESLSKQQYWTGVGGQILRSCAIAANTTLEKLFYLTESNRTPSDSEIQNCSHFLIKEIEELKSALILSFGKLASTFLLKREVRVKMEHGCIYAYNKETKILVLLHPTGIDRQMNRSTYTKQLTSLFLKLKEDKHDEIDEIFNSQRTTSWTE